MPSAEGSASLLTELPSGTLTFLLSDIEQSTTAWDQHPDEMRRSMEMHDEIFQKAVSHHHGRLVELGREGDSVLCVFRRPSEAVACALDIQLALHRALWPSGAALRVRVALHTGEADLRDGHYFGPAVYRCARLMSTSNGGQTVLSGPTHDLVVDSLPDSVTLLDLGSHRLKDLTRPERVFQLMHPDLPQDFPVLKTLDAELTNLPTELTSFLGREAELSELKKLVGKSRLVTISGAGGLGKTRIALHLAAELMDAFPDGVWLVELAAVPDPTLAVGAFAKSVGVREVPGTPLLQTLTAHLQTRSCLIVIDNCEHLIGECARLSEHLLAKCPEVTLLATSRELLGVTGEQLWRLSPLALPPATGKPSARELTESEAVRLFVDRAWPNQPVPEFDEHRASTILRICQRLDGIPLAIELAAARAKVMTVDDLLVRLDDRFRLLTGGGRTAGPRQQTLRATVDWSYELLEPSERKLFRRLSVFAGGFALADVEAVCAGVGEQSGEIVELMARLVDKSLTIPVGAGDGEAPMRQLETLQQYGRERLIEAGEASLYLRRHADHFLQLAEREKNAGDRRDDSSWLDRLDSQHDNLRAALQTSQTESADLNLRLATALLALWDARGYLTEGRDWLEKALAAWPEETALRAEALGAAGWLSQRLGDFDRAAACFEESVRIARVTQQGHLAAESLANLALVRLLHGQSQQAGPLVREAIAIAEDLDDHYATAGALLVMGLVAYFEGDFDQSKACAERSLALHRELGNEKVAAFLLACLATLAIDNQDEAMARANLRESLEISRRLHEKVDVAFVLETCARFAVARSDPGFAVKLAGAAASVRETVGAPAAPPWRAMVEMSQESARADLGPEVTDLVWREGRALSLEKAIDQALEWLNPQTGAAPVRSDNSQTEPAGLTKREREVAALVGRGLRNREIASKLFLAPRTVDAHVEHIRNKLDLHSRTQIAAWAASQGLIED
jgi:predicted ATPase/class 3 adenylate cyclase/DNA-binding CsgD family transcriptional regulator